MQLSISAWTPPGKGGRRGIPYVFHVQRLLLLWVRVRASAIPIVDALVVVIPLHNTTRLLIAIALNQILTDLQIMTVRGRPLASHRPALAATLRVCKPCIARDALRELGVGREVRLCALDAVGAGHVRLLRKHTLIDSGCAPADAEFVGVQIALEAALVILIVAAALVVVLAGSGVQTGHCLALALTPYAGGILGERDVAV